jgi:protein gp37
MENSKIEWTDHTFNPWWGCMKVSPGCKNCYAEALDHRWKGGHWGPDSPRKMQSENTWLQPFIWDEAARKAGVKAKVFCASMADVFEGHPDTLQSLARLLTIIEHTPNLIWQLLTKRPENINTLLMANKSRWYKDGFPPNLWIGTSVENQEMADQRIPELLAVPCALRFLSCEPLLGPVDLTMVTQTVAQGFFGDCLIWYHRGECHRQEGIKYPTIDWVIVGGESGHGARPMNVEWPLSIMNQCKASNVPFFFKQWGEYLPIKLEGMINKAADGTNRFYHYEKEIGHLFLRSNDQLFYKSGKKNAGSILDGVEHKNFPS